MKNLRNGGSGNLSLLLDTNILFWVATGDGRLSKRASAAIGNENNQNFISAVTAWEFVELNAAGRFGADLDFKSIAQSLMIEILPLPVEIWQVSAALPPIHRDPVDRMVIAHAIQKGLTLVTGDRKMREYPVTSIW